jgi:hypothetical protein
MKTITYAVVIGVLSLGTALIPYGKSYAMLASAVVFGWAQIGGL